MAVGIPRSSSEADDEESSEYARFVGRGLAEAWAARTPQVQMRKQPSEADYLKAEAERARLDAVAEGRAAPSAPKVDDEIERARGERIAKLAEDEETRLEAKRVKRHKPDES